MKRDSEAYRATIKRHPHALPRDTVKNAAWDRPTAPLPIGDPDLDSPLQGTLLPAERYRATVLLGQGGMGEVRSALDGKIGREIALKRMLPQPPKDAATAQARFLREARVQALLEHPAIVPVYDIDVGADGLPFFTMKRVRGETLNDIIQASQPARKATAGSSRLHRLLSAFTTVCLAMEYAHQRGVVHRDLKPENIMLGPHGEVYILDWGIAKILSRGDDTPLELELGDSETRPGEMVGTPGFMPPEQILGQHESIDARSDVYALGAILHEILHKRPLHPGDDVVAIVESTMSPQSPPPATEGVPPELAKFAFEATRFHKDDRPGSARALADAVERYLDGDRDLGLRNKLADVRASEAERLGEVALTGPSADREAARVRAMHEAAGALALAPSHAGAASVVLRLLANPPEREPEVVERELADLDRVHTRRAMRDNALRVSSWILLAPLAILMGPRIPWLAGLIIAFLGVSGALAALMWRLHLTGAGARLSLFIATSTFGALVASMFGPFIFVPGFAALNTLLFSAQTGPSERKPMILIGCATFLVPLALELVGWVPPSLVFEPDAIRIPSRLVSFPPGVTLAFLATVSILGIVTPTLLTGRIRDALRVAERSLMVQKWQLSQLSAATAKTGT